MAVIAPYAMPASVWPVPDRPTSAPGLIEHEPDTGPQDFGQSDISPTMMTIAVVDEVGTKWGATDAVTDLAQLAATDELVVVYGAQEHQYGTGVEPLVVRLRDQLPRHTVVVLYAAAHDGSLRRAAGLLDELLELGSLPVVVTASAMVPDVAGELYHRLRADRMMKVTGSRAVCGFNGNYAGRAA